MLKHKIHAVLGVLGVAVAAHVAFGLATGRCPLIDLVHHLHGSHTTAPAETSTTN
jgi:hypothetical protein